MPQHDLHTSLGIIFRAVSDQGASFCLDGPNDGASTRAIAGTLATPNYDRHALFTGLDLHDVIVGLAKAWERSGALTLEECDHPLMSGAKP